IEGRGQSLRPQTRASGYFADVRTWADAAGGAQWCGEIDTAAADCDGGAAEQGIDCLGRRARRVAAYAWLRTASGGSAGRSDGARICDAYRGAQRFEPRASG